LSDPGSVQDVPAILKKMGHQIEIQQKSDNNLVVLTVIIKG